MLRETLRDLDRVGLGDSPGQRFVEGYEMPRIAAIARHLREIPGPEVRVLDVGFLAGRVPFVLTRLDPRLRIVSTERDQVTAAAARARAADLHLDVEVEVLDLTEPMPSQQAAFDAVVLGEVIEHIPGDDMPAVLTGVREKLRDGGVLIVTTPNLHGAMARLRHLLGVDFAHDPVPDEVMGMPHINLMSARGICDLAAVAGFEPAAVEFHDFTSGQHTSRKRSMLRAVRTRSLSRWVPDSRDDMVIVLRRSQSVGMPSPVFGSNDASLRAGLASRGVPARD